MDMPSPSISGKKRSRKEGGRKKKKSNLIPYPLCSKWRRKKKNVGERNPKFARGGEGKKEKEEESTIIFTVPTKDGKKKYCERSLMKRKRRERDEYSQYSYRPAFGEGREGG